MTLIANDLQTTNVIPFCNIEGHTSSNCQCDSVVLLPPPVLRRQYNSRLQLHISSAFRDRLGEILNTPLNFPLPPVCFLEGHTETTCDCDW